MVMDVPERGSPETIVMVGFFLRWKKRFIVFLRIGRLVDWVSGNFGFRIANSLRRLLSSVIHYWPGPKFLVQHQQFH